MKKGKCYYNIYNLLLYCNTPIISNEVDLRVHLNHDGKKDNNYSWQKEHQMVVVLVCFLYALQSRFLDLNSCFIESI